MNSGDYPLHRKRAWLSVFMLTGFCLAFAFVGLVISEIGWRIACFVAAGGAALGVVHAWRLLADPRPVLHVGPDGLVYAPFANQTVPWSDITAMTRVLYYNRSVFMGRTSWTRMPSHDQLFFAVADEQRYPNGPGRWFTRTVQKLGGVPPINIQLWIVDAEPDAIVREIDKHWPGSILQMDPRPAHLIQP